MRVILAALLCLLLAPAHARTGLHVYDGDTFSVDALRYRLAHVDAPEIGWRGKCPEERALALKARDELRLWLSESFALEPVRGRDRWRRTLVIVRLRDVTTAQERLIANGLAVAYEGRGPRHMWCAP